MNTASLSLTAYMLGPEGRGAIVGISTWVNLIATLGCLSLGQVVIHRAAIQGDTSWIRPAFSSLFASALMLSLITWILVLTLWFVMPGVYGALPVWGLVIGFAALPFVIWEAYGGNLLLASGDLSFLNRRLAMSAAMSLMLLTGVLLIGGGVGAALTVNLGMSALVATVGFYRLWEKVEHRFEFKSSWMRKLFIDGTKLHLNAVGGVLILGTDVLIVNYYLSPSDVGFYQLAVQLLGGMMIVPASASMVLNQAMSQKGPEGVWPSQRRLVFQLMIVMIAGAAMVYVLAPQIIIVIAGPAFTPAIDSFRLLLLSVGGMTLSFGMANQWLGRGLFIQTAITTLISGVANLMLNFLLVPRMGINGAALSTVIVYNAGLLVNLGMVAYIEARVGSPRAQSRVLSA